MTLIITEVSEYGIAMVADSVVTIEEVTPSGTRMKVSDTAQKLQYIPQLEASISMWGLGTINASTGQVSTHSWISEFIHRQRDIESIDDFAGQLCEELQKVVGDTGQALGFHLAGYVEKKGKRLPTFYHVRNVEGAPPNFEYHEFITGQDFPPQELAKGEFHRTRNGDFVPYAILADAVDRVLPEITRVVDIVIPYPSLDGRIAYLATWIRFVSNLYASSQMKRTIGGHLSGCGITLEGKITFSSI